MKSKIGTVLLITSVLFTGCSSSTVMDNVEEYSTEIEVNHQPIDQDIIYGLVEYGLIADSDEYVECKYLLQDTGKPTLVFKRNDNTYYSILIGSETSNMDCFVHIRDCAVENDDIITDDKSVLSVYRLSRESENAKYTVEYMPMFDITDRYIEEAMKDVIYEDEKAVQQIGYGQATSSKDDLKQFVYIREDGTTFCTSIVKEDKDSDSVAFIVKMFNCEYSDDKEPSERIDFNDQIGQYEVILSKKLNTFYAFKITN